MESRNISYLPRTTADHTERKPDTNCRTDFVGMANHKLRPRISHKIK